MPTTYVETPMAYGGSGASPLPAVKFNFATGQRFAITTTSTQSAAISAILIAVRSMDADIWVSIGASPTAGANATSFPVAKGELLFFPLTAGQKIAVATDTGAGNVTVMPCV